MPDAEDVTFAVYHAGREADAHTVATDCRAALDEVDAPLAEAVEKGWLERFQSGETGRIAFRLTDAGEAFVTSGTAGSATDAP